MNDEIHDRTYQSGRAQFNDDLGKAIEAVLGALKTTFERSRAIQFDAPWARRSRDVGCA